MATIPEETKAELKNSGAKFNRDPMTERPIHGNLLAVAKRAVGNAIIDNEPYTIRINFQNGRIVGSKGNPRLTVELLEGRASTPVIGVADDSHVAFVEIDSLVTEGFAPVTNGGDWVVRLTIKNGNVASVYVNPDFSEEDRELIQTVLMRGFADQIQM